MYDTCELEYLSSKTIRVIKSCKTVAQLHFARDFVWLAQDRYFKLTGDWGISCLFGMKMCFLISDMIRDMSDHWETFEVPEFLVYDLNFGNPFDYPKMPKH